MEQNREARNKPVWVWPVDFGETCKRQVKGERTAFSISSVVTIENQHTHKTSLVLVSHLLEKWSQNGP